MKKFLREGIKKDLYTMEAGIDFPMVMNCRTTEPCCEAKLQQTSSSAVDYFYYLNGHNDVEFASLAFGKFAMTTASVSEMIETYEYKPWGILLKQANKNNLLFHAKQFDLETKNIFYLEGYYAPDIAYAVINSSSKKDIYYLILNNAKIMHLKLNIFQKEVTITCFAVVSDKKGCTKVVCFKCWKSTFGKLCGAPYPIYDCYFNGGVICI